MYYSYIGLCVIIRALRGTLLKSRGCNPKAAIISDLTSQCPKNHNKQYSSILIDRIPGWGVRVDDFKSEHRRRSEVSEWKFPDDVWLRFRPTHLFSQKSTSPKEGHTASSLLNTYAVWLRPRTYLSITGNNALIIITTHPVDCYIYYQE